MTTFKYVEKNRSISNNVFNIMHIKLSSVISIKDIAKDTYVSQATITGYMLKNTSINKRKHLPENICIDEFKSVENVDEAMSFICINADTYEIIDIYSNLSPYISV